MSALALFYSPTLKLDDASALIEGVEARHIYAARRIAVGAKIAITNGQGIVANAQISQIDKKKQQVALQLTAVQSLPRPARWIHLLVAIPKGDRQSTMLDMLTQLGVDQITPLMAQHSVSPLNLKALERWRRIVIEASKQSRRAWFPVVEEPMHLKDWLQDKNDQPDQAPQGPALLLDQAGKSLQHYQTQLQSTEKLSVLIGSEAGFTEQEQAAMLDQGVQTVKLGAHILRIETAAVAIISALNQIEGKA